MPLVPAKCPECGGNINIDSGRKAAICEFCKQPFIVEEAINNFNTTYNITNNNVINADIVNVQSFPDLQNLIKDMELKIEFGLKKTLEDNKDNTFHKAMIELKSLINENSSNSELKYLYLNKLVEVLEIKLQGGIHIEGQYYLRDLVRMYEYLSYIKYEDLKGLFGRVINIFEQVHNVIIDGCGYNDSNIDLVIAFLRGACIEPYKKTINEFLDFFDDYEQNNDMSQKIVYGSFGIYLDDYDERYRLEKLNVCISSIDDYKNYYKHLQSLWLSYVKKCDENNICSKCSNKKSFLGKCKTFGCDGGKLSYKKWRIRNIEWVKNGAIDFIWKRL